MRRSKQMKRQQPKALLQTGRLDVINNESYKPVIPVGPPFQAKIPDWTGPPRSEYYKDFSSTKWLGIRVWPNQEKNPKTKVEAIGKGKPAFCSCASPESVECVKRHIRDKRLQLQSDLGPAFWRWKFDEIGEEASKLLSLHEQQKFDRILKRSSPSQDNTLVKVASECFPTKRRKMTRSAFHKVSATRRMKLQTRFGCEVVDTYDDEDSGFPFPEDSRKRFQANDTTKSSGKRVKC